MRNDTRDRIIRSAIKVAIKKGITKLTLAEVAKTAKISRGGVLYHFPSKDDLLKGLLQESVSEFLGSLVNTASADKTPGASMRAFIALTFAGPGKGLNDISAALLTTLLITGTAVGREMLAYYQSSLEQWSDLIASDGLDDIDAAVIQMAADGLFLHEALGLRPLSAERRQKFLDRLVELTKVQGAPARPIALSKSDAPGGDLTPKMSQTRQRF
jgi:AcrR family transcriptional regulator